MRFTPLLTTTALLGCALASQTARAHSHYRLTTNFDDRTLLQTTIGDLQAAHTNIDDLAFGPGGEWMIVADDVIYRSASIPAAMVTKVQQYIDSGRTIDAIAIAPNGSWVVAADDWFFRSAGAPMGPQLQDVVKNRQNAGHQIDEIVFTPGGGFIVLSEGYTHGQAVNSNLFAALEDADASKRRSRRIAIGDDGRWILLGENWSAQGNISSTQQTQLKTFQRNETSIDHIGLGVGDDHFFYSHNTAVLKPALPMRNLEYSLVDENGITKNVWQRMNDLGVPGLSVAVIHNGVVQWARGYGEMAFDDQRFVRASTPFAVASLSKYVSALVAMRRRNANAIEFNTDARTMAVDGFTNMSFWKYFGESDDFYDTPLPAGITLNRLLSHTASMNQNENAPDGWGGYIDGAEVSTLEILLGYGCDGAPCGTMNKTVWHDPALGAPTTTYQYSNSGYEVMRAMLEDIDGLEFEDIAQNEVLGPLGMTNSTFQQPLTASFAARSAPPVNGAGNAMTRKSYQWIAGGGLYASAGDYAKAVAVLVNLADTHASGFLDLAETSEMLQDQAPGSDRYGLGIDLSQTQVSAASGLFFHGGYLPNYSRSSMIGWPADRSGVVIITNDGSTSGERLVCEIEKAFLVSKGLGGGCS